MKEAAEKSWVGDSATLNRSVEEVREQKVFSR
jgi:hypothetical protein